MNEHGPKTIDEFREIFEAMQPRLLGTARRILRDEADAEDIIQDVALTALSSPHLFAEVENLAGWLVTVVFRRSIDLWRKLARRRAGDGDFAEQSANDADDAEARRAEAEMLAAVAEAIRALPAELRFAFEGNAIRGKTFQQLAEDSGTPPGTLMARKKRALAQIRQTLRERGVLD